MRIEVESLTHIYNAGQDNEMKALDNVSFTVESGVFAGIIGHTGSGKSTLLQHLNGLMKPDSGNIRIDGKNTASGEISMTELRRSVGLVFQYPEYQLFEETVEKDIAFGPSNLGLDEESIKERVREAMELTGLDQEKFGSRSPMELSGGQKRRIAIAGVLAMMPSVLILDEPAAGLDPASHRGIMEMIDRIRRERHCTVILVSHNMEDIAEYCQQVLVMDHGRLIMQGTPDEIFSREEDLCSIGLEIPECRRLILELRRRGFDISSDGVLCDDTAADVITEYFKKENR